MFVLTCAPKFIDKPFFGGELAQGLETGEGGNERPRIARRGPDRGAWLATGPAGMPTHSGRKGGAKGGGRIGGKNSQDT